MVHRSTAEITQECDRLAQECDTVLNSACIADVSIDRLCFSAGQMGAQIELLDKAQAHLEQQRRSLSNKLFWLKLRPSALLQSTRTAISGRWSRKGPALRPGWQGRP